MYDFLLRSGVSPLRVRLIPRRCNRKRGSWLLALRFCRRDPPGHWRRASLYIFRNAVHARLRIGVGCVGSVQYVTFSLLFAHGELFQRPYRGRSSVCGILRTLKYTRCGNLALKRPQWPVSCRMMEREIVLMCHLFFVGEFFQRPSWERLEIVWDFLYTEIFFTLGN